MLSTYYTLTESLRWQLDEYDIENGYAKNIISRFKLSYYIENVYYNYNDVKPFITSLKEKRNVVFHNGRIRIWCIDCGF